MNVNITQELDILFFRVRSGMDIQNRLDLETVTNKIHAPRCLRNEVPPIFRKAGIASHGDFGRLAIPGRRKKQVSCDSDAGVPACRRYNFTDHAVFLNSFTQIQPCKVHMAQFRVSSMAE